MESFREGIGVVGLALFEVEEGFFEEVFREGALEGGGGGGDDEAGLGEDELAEGADAVGEGGGLGGGVFEEDGEAAGEEADAVGGDSAEGEAGLPLEGFVVVGDEKQDAARVFLPGGGHEDGPRFGADFLPEGTIVEACEVILNVGVAGHPFGRVAEPHAGGIVPEWWRCV